jgi:hypothetical protein
LAKKSKRKATREPDHYDPPFEPEFEEEPIRQVPKYKAKLMYLLNQDEVNALINAPDIATSEETVKHTNYSTYAEYEVLALMNGNYIPPKTKKKQQHGNE